MHLDGVLGSVMYLPSGCTLHYFEHYCMNLVHSLISRLSKLCEHTVEKHGKVWERGYLVHTLYTSKVCYKYYISLTTECIFSCHKQQCSGRISVCVRNVWIMIQENTGLLLTLPLLRFNLAHASIFERVHSY